MSEIETLIVRRAAAMAEKDGIGVQIVHVFGATSQLSAALAEARDRLINHPGQIADTLSALFDADDAAAGGDADLDPVEAARKAADEAQTAALEAAQRADELTAEADRLQAQKEADEAAAAAAAEAERLAAEEAAAAAAQAEGEPAAPEQEQTGGEQAEASADAPEQEQEAAAPAAKPTRKAK